MDNDIAVTAFKSYNGVIGMTVSGIAIGVAAGAVIGGIIINNSKSYYTAFIGCTNLTLYTDQVHSNRAWRCVKVNPAKTLTVINESECAGKKSYSSY